MAEDGSRTTTKGRRSKFALLAQLVEHNIGIVGVVCSNHTVGSKKVYTPIAQLVEYLSPKQRVACSSRAGCAVMENTTVKFKYGDGVVVAYCDATPGGVIVSGATKEEALAKYEKAFEVYRLVKTLIVTENRLN